MNYQGVFTFELLQFINVIDQEQQPNKAQASTSKQTFLNKDNKLSVDFKTSSSMSGLSSYSDTLTFDKKAYLDHTLFINNNSQNETLYQDLVFTYDSDKGQFKGILDGQLLKEEIYEQRKLQSEKEIELMDLHQVGQFKIKVKISFCYSNIEQIYLSPQNGMAIVKQSSITNYLLTFSDIEVQNGQLVAARKRSVQNNDIQKSEIYLVLELEKQKFELDIENPKGTDRKNPTNTFFMFKNGETIKATLEERIYKLERDEAAFLESIRQINTKQATSINQFLISRTRGYGMLPGAADYDLNSLVKKKKILQETKLILTKEILIESDLITAETQFCQVQDLQVRLDFDILMTGLFQVSVNKFINMPRGSTQVNLVGYSKFSKDENINFEELVFKIQKQTNKDNDRLLYIFNETQWLNMQTRPRLLFDTYFFDDIVKIDVFHKNSTIKSNLTGKGFIELNTISFDEDSIIGVPIFNKKILRVVGYVFLKVNYSPRKIELFEDDWLLDLESTSKLDKYQYFDSYLTNEFKNVCHYGYLQVTLTAVDIPLPFQQPTEVSQQVQQLFMIKIKEGTHQNQIIVGAPNRILDIQHQIFYTLTQSLNERISIEFYQILSEEAFNPETKVNFKNMRLISHLLFPIKNVPFDSDSIANDVKFLVNIQKSGQVAALTFNFKYQRQVPEEQLGVPIDQKVGGLIFLKLVQSEEFTFHHDKDLDKHQFIVDISNETRQLSFQRRLFFNKLQIPIGFIDIRIQDRLKISFFVIKAGTENKELIEEFQYEVISQGLKGLIDSCKNELIEVLSWQPLHKPFTLSYDGMPKYRPTGTLANLQQSAPAGGTLSRFTAKQGLYGTNQTHPFKTQIGFANQQQKKFILEGVVIEMELRTSDFSMLNSRGLLEAGLVQVYFNLENIKDLLSTRDITENASIELANISSDKRSLRETKTFYLNEIDFESPFVLRSFNINDVLQIKIKDLYDTFGSMKLAEMPLSVDRHVIQYIQVGSKQLQLSIVLGKDPTLMPQQDQQSNSLASKLFGQLEAGVKGMVAQQKEASELQKKLLELNGKPVPEQIKLLKVFINDQESKNKQLITKQLRLRNEFEKAQKKIEEAQNAKPLPPKPKIDARNKDFMDVNKMLSGVVHSKGDQQQASNKQTGPNLCGCGSTNPKFKGYCVDCVTKLKATFDRYLEKFKQLQEEYDEYTGIDQTKADEKLRLMKNKIEQYEIKLSDNEILNVIEKHEKIAQSDENRNFAEFKVTVQSLKQEIEIARVKQDIELQDLKKQEDYLELQVAKKLSQKKDIEREITTLQEVLNQMQVQSEDIDKRIVLKKRYVLSQNQRSDGLVN